MKNEGLATRYSAALNKYLSHPDEVTLLSAYELGREALARGLGILDVATIHSRALGSALEGPLPHDRSHLIDHVTNFLNEALSPFEMGHRAFWDANMVLRRLNDLLEAQARRIAYTLHDEASQLLAAVYLALAEGVRELPENQAYKFVDVKSLLDQIEERLRNLSHELRPPMLEHLGLGPSLEILADGVSKRWGLPVTIKSSVETEIPIPVGITIYRIAQEALTNVAKHADASCAEIDLRETDQKVVCSVRDDGIGIDVTAARNSHSGLGLVEIKERVAAVGGIMHLGANKNRGTELTIEIPLEGESLG
jgi:signal transduction histidine kinase